MSIYIYMSYTSFILDFLKLFDKGSTKISWSHVWNHRLLILRSGHALGHCEKTGLKRINFGVGKSFPAKRQEQPRNLRTTPLSWNGGVHKSTIWTHGFKGCARCPRIKHSAEGVALPEYLLPKTWRSRLLTGKLTGGPSWFMNQSSLEFIVLN